MFTFEVEMRVGLWEVSGKRFKTIQGAMRALARHMKASAENGAILSYKIVKL